MGLLATFWRQLQMAVGAAHQQRTHLSPISWRHQSTDLTYFLMLHHQLVPN